MRKDGNPLPAPAKSNVLRRGLWVFCHGPLDAAEGYGTSIQQRIAAVNDIRYLDKECTTMNFEQFNQVALDDPLTLMVAMELLLQNGRGMIDRKSVV